MSTSNTIFPVPCVPIVKSAFEVSVDKVSVLKVTNSPSVAWNSGAVTTPPDVGPSTKFVPAAGESVILPEVDESTLPSNLKLSTFNCPDVDCVPVCVISVGNTNTPVPAGLIVMLWFEFEIQLSALIEPSIVKSPPKFPVPLTVVLPVVVMSAVVKVPETDALPVTAVVAPNAIVPEPPGLIVIFAFELDEISESFKIKLSTVTFPVIVAPLIVGDVITLFVNVCEPDNVATVASMFKVTVWLPATDVRPVPPAIVNDCESKSTAPVPESPARSKSCAVTCESTYALIDCCVASCVAEFVAMLSSSKIPVTVAPVANAKLVDKLVAPDTFKPSLICTCVESSELIDVPLNFNELALTEPVPCGAKTISLFVVETML